MNAGQETATTFVGALGRGPLLVAGWNPSQRFARMLQAADYPHLLVSFARYLTQHDRPVDLGYRPRSVITDSGAYTVWRSKGRIDLERYVTWCQHWQSVPVPVVHVNLDAIPEDDSPRETLRCVDAGLANADRMRKAGLVIGEVYHQGEDLGVLDALIQRRRAGDLLCISPREGIGPGPRREFLDAVFNRVLWRCDRSALPPLHGLGLARREALLRYPWYSVDSASWTSAARWGIVLDKRKGGHQYDPMAAAPEYSEKRMREYLGQWVRWEDEGRRLWQSRGVTWVQ